jgi:hypothetical protein
MNLERMLGGKLDGYVPVPKEGAPPETVKHTAGQLGTGETGGLPAAADAFGVEGTERAGAFEQRPQNRSVRHAISGSGGMDAQILRRASRCIRNNSKKCILMRRHCRRISKGQTVLARRPKTADLRDAAQAFLGHDVIFTQILSEISGYFARTGTRNTQNGGDIGGWQARIEYLKNEMRKMIF